VKRYNILDWLSLEDGREDGWQSERLASGITGVLLRLASDHELG
jgi:hypothetical protein